MHGDFRYYTKQNFIKMFDFEHTVLVAFRFKTVILVTLSKTVI